MTRRPTLGELDAGGYSIKAPAPMLDPSWTPAAGYAHAGNVAALLERADRARELAALTEALHPEQELDHADRY